MDNGTCTYRVVVPGCKSPTATNYNPLANSDDGSCMFGTVLGCNEPSAYNYDSRATVDDGSCLYDVMGCTDPDAPNWDEDATMENGSCDRVVIGCMDITAFNYDSSANVDSLTCIAKVEGCIDPTAANFDPAANTSPEDDTCCPVPRVDSAVIPAYATCMNDDVSFRAAWTPYIDEHELFSTNDHSKAMFEVRELKETHEKMNAWY